MDKKKKKLSIDWFFRNVTHQYFELEGDIKGTDKKGLRKMFATNYIEKIKKEFEEDLIDSRTKETDAGRTVYLRIKMNAIVSKYIMPNFK